MSIASLELFSLSPEGWAAILAGPAAIEAWCGHPPADGFCEMYDTGDITQAYFAKLLAPGPADPWLHGFLLLDPVTGRLVGGCGFKGPPNERGEVEIAYGITPGERGRGFATTAAQLLIAYAEMDKRVKQVMAYTLPTGEASHRVLAKRGFTHVGETIDPDDGLVWRWERPPIE